MKHLSDEEIQIYLDKSDSSKRTEIHEHLTACRTCRGRVKQYERLYSRLSTLDIAHTLPPDFAPSVMEKVKVSSTSGFAWLDYLLFALGSIGSIAMTLYYSPTNWLSRFLFNLSEILQTSFLDFFEKIQLLMQKSDIQPHLLLPIGIIIILFFLLDKLFIQTRLR